VKQND